MSYHAPPPKPIPSPGFLTWLLVIFLHIMKALRGPLTLERFRKQVAALDRRKVVLPEGITKDQTVMAGITCDRVHNPGADRLVLHFYGGAGCARLPNITLPAIARFCKRIGAEAILPWYALAPEHKFPAGAMDCFSVYKAILADGYTPSNIIMSGDSAGGANALSVLALIKQHKLPMPGCVVLLSPGGDTLMLGASWTENARRDPIFKVADIENFFDINFKSVEDRASPLVNISKMDPFDGYPPLYATASSDEVLRDIAVSAHEKAKRAGVPTQLDIYKGSVHVMHLLTFGNQVKPAWARIDHFVNVHMKH